MRMASVYLETSIIGYLTSRLSRDLIVAAHQQITREWWDLRRTSYELYVSEAVVAECDSGDTEAARERLQQIAGLPILDISEDAERLAEQLLLGVPLPAKAQIDALHMALAAVNGLDYLLTWNCRHIANAVLQTKIEAVCRAAGYNSPIICTPDQLMEV
ncbi:MAG: type II toxin-antitoxin system VapC family toxin [Pirellulales bacterium]